MTRGADEHEWEVGRRRVGERPEQFGDALARLERADCEHVVLGQLECCRALVGVVGQVQRAADRTGDDADAVAEVECFGELLGDGVRRHDDRVGVALRALGHRLAPGDGAGCEGLGVRPRDGVVDGDDDLLTGVVEAVVAVERCEQARRVHHARTGQPREPVLPGRGELAPIEGALEQLRQPRQLALDAVVVALRRRRHDAHDIAAARGCLDELPRELEGVAADAGGGLGADLVEDDAKGRRTHRCRPSRTSRS